jgi:metal-responsive CopG/Arc/MetJ family transcriptional regulator
MHHSDTYNMVRHVPHVDSVKKVKTTIDIPENMWREFSIKVIQRHGGRKKNDVIQELLQKYIDEDDD